MHTNQGKRISKTYLRRSHRNQKGDFLVEALVSVLVSSVLGLALAQMYTQVHYVGNMSQAQMLAASVAQEAIDHLRSLPFSMLLANTGLHTVQVNGNGTMLVAGTPISDPLFPRALLQDVGSFTGTGGTSSSLDYTCAGDSKVSSGIKNVLNTVDPLTGAASNTIFVTLTPATVGSAQAVKVTVDIAWTDSSVKMRRYTLSSMLSQDGIGSI